MSDFEKQLEQFLGESMELQKTERELEAKNSMFNDKLFAFLRQHGLPEKFTLPELAMLAVRKAKA